MSHPPMLGLLLNYRDAARSVRCIQSLIKDGVEQVIVWDNSADGGESARAIGCALRGEQRVHIEVNDENIGFAAGVNRGLQRCMQLHGKARVLLINNDAVLLRGALPKLRDALDSHTKAWIAFPNIKQAVGVSGPVYYNRLTGLLSQTPHKWSFLHASGCCLVIATDRVDMPLFDEDFFMYGEDAELGWRLRRHPNSLVHVNETLVTHDGSASSGIGSRFYEDHMVAAHLILIDKLALNRLDKVSLWMGHVLALIVRAIIRGIRYKSTIPLTALFRGARLARRSALRVPIV